MLPDVEMVSFLYGSGADARRDTLRGPASVTDWLDDLRLEGRPGGARFGLRTSQVLLCDSAAVETGRFPRSAITSMDRLRRLPGEERYLALWRPEGGAWMLEQLWLSPPTSVRPARLASGCGAARRAARAARPFRVGVALRVGGGAELQEVVESLDDAGWPDPSVRKPGRLGPRVWASYRIGPRLEIGPVYDRLIGTRARASEADDVQSRTVTVESGGHVLSLRTQARLGPLWIGAGPAVAWTTTTYDASIVSTDAVVDELERETNRSFGALAEASFRITRVPTLVPVLSVGYLYLPDLEPETTAPAAIPVGGLTFTLGAELVP